PGGLGRFPEPLARFAIGAAPAGSMAPAGQGGALPPGFGVPRSTGSGEWASPGQSTAEQEVAAARQPRVEPPGQDDEGDTLGPPRIPGVGPHPGQFGPSTTGPIPVLADSPAESAAYGGSSGQEPAAAFETAGDSFGTVPTPASGAEFPAVP